MAKDPNKIQDAMKQTRERLGDAIDAVASKSDVASRVGQTVSDTATNVKTRLQDGAEKFNRSTDMVRSSLPEPNEVRRGIQNPLAILVGVAAVGFIAGLLIPLSDVERVRLEPIGDDLAQRAVDARDEIVLQGRQVVAETVSAARASVQKHGDELAETLGVESDPQPKGDVILSAATADEAQKDETKVAEGATKSKATPPTGGAASPPKT